MPRNVNLRLCDLHFSHDREADQSIVIKALTEDITKGRLDRDLAPDLVSLSGDIGPVDKVWQPYFCGSEGEEC